MNNVDVNKIVDDAMEKKDRQVCIFISDVGTTVKVQPLSDSDPRWIMRKKVGSKSTQYAITKTIYECSECHDTFDYPTPYCPSCGEKLRFPCEEDYSKEGTDE